MPNGDSDGGDIKRFHGEKSIRQLAAFLINDQPRFKGHLNSIFHYKPPILRLSPYKSYSIGIPTVNRPAKTGDPHGYWGHILGNISRKHGCLWLTTYAEGTSNSRRFLKWSMKNNPFFHNTSWLMGFPTMGDHNPQQTEAVKSLTVNQPGCFWWLKRPLNGKLYKPIIQFPKVLTKGHWRQRRWMSQRHASSPLMNDRKSCDQWYSSAM